MEETFSVGSDEIYKELVISSPVAIYTCDAQGYVTFFNQAASILWGRAPKIGVDLWCGSWKIYYPDGKPMALDECPMALTLKNAKSFEGAEIVIERPDHTFKSLLVYPKPIFNEDKRLIGAHNTLVDITEQKSNDEKQAILSAIVESSDDAIVSKNLQGIIKSWNAGAQKIFGYREEEVIGKHISILIPEELRTQEDDIIANIKAGRKVDHFQTIRMHKTGVRIPISLTVSPVKDNFGNIIGASKIARDISERVQAERTIQQTAERLEILNTIGASISKKLDVEVILQNVTDATAKITGATFGIFLYNKVSEKGESSVLATFSGIQEEVFEKFVMPSNATVFQSIFNSEKVIRIDDITKESRYTKNVLPVGKLEGELAFVSYLAVAVISSSDEIIGALFFGHPKPNFFNEEHEALVVSIASQASVALENSMLFEEVKTLSAKKDEFIALASHELKTPLTTIKGYLQILNRTIKDQLSTTFIQKSITQAEKLNALVSDLFDISRIEGGKLHFDFEVFQLKDLLVDVIETFHHNITTHSIVLEDQDQSKDTGIEADQQRVEQVLINLISNAIKYSPKANKVFVKLEASEEALTIKIRDEGMGLTTDQQRQIFTRFYRAENKSGISGLGLGLYLTKEIIDRHNGSIAVSSAFGKGSEFMVTLPKRRKTNHIK
jgi:PAS domain S-box-containing protein